MLRTSICGVVAMSVALSMSTALAADAATDAIAKAQPAPAIGAQVADFVFKDIRFAPHTLSDLGEKKAYVVVFTTLDCPVVKRYLPRVVELEKAYRNRDVQFLAMNVGPNDSIVELAYQGLQVDAAFPFCKDFDGDVAKAVGASRTPQVVVLDGERKLRYRGRIDSQFRTTGENPAAGREDLKEAIDDVLAGRPVSVAETPVDGCPISYAKIPAPRSRSHLPSTSRL